MSPPDEPAPKGLSVWVVYDHPKDYPDSYVARCFINEQPTENVMFCTSLERLQEELVYMGLAQLARMEDDDPVIIETWL